MIVSYILKLALLMSKHLLVSDTQLVDNRGVRALFTRKAVREFLKTPDPDGVTPTIACVRGLSGFEKVLEEWLINREKPALFSSLSKEQNDQIQQKYGKEGVNTLGPFYDICRKGGEDFESHIKNLEEVFQRTDISRTEWGKLKRKYPESVAEAVTVEKAILTTLINKRKVKHTEDIHIQVMEKQLRLCQLIESTVEKGGLDRSALYNKINVFDAPESIKPFVKRQILDKPYNDGFAEANQSDLIRGDKYQVISLLDGAPNIAQKTEKPYQILKEVKIFPLSLRGVSFAAIRKIRSSDFFLKGLELLHDPSEEKNLRFIDEYLPNLYGQLAQVPKGTEKVKMRVMKVFGDQNMRETLAENGLTWEDYLSFSAKGISLVPVPLVGKAAAWVLQKVGDAPRRKQEKELKHIIALRVLRNK